MYDKLNNILKKIPLEKILYPAMTLIFTAAVVILFSRAIIFLSKSLNDVFLNNDPAYEEKIPDLDFPNYELIRKRFGWPEFNKSEPVLSSITAPASVSTSTSISTSTESTDNVSQ